MRVYAQLGLTSEACSLLAQLRAAGLSVQAHAYNTVMHGLAEAEDGDFLEIMQVFRRMWLYYFAYCEAGFLERSIGDVQMLLTRPRNRRAQLLPEL